MLSDGAAYDPETGAWRSIAVPEEFAGRYGHVAVWTGSEMLVFSGQSQVGNASTSAAYDPLSDTWRAISPSPEITGAVARFPLDGDAVVLSEHSVHLYDPEDDTWSRADTVLPALDGAPLRTGEVALAGIGEGGEPHFGAVDPRTGRSHRIPAQGIHEGPWEGVSLAGDGRGRLWTVLSHQSGESSFVYSLEEGGTSWKLEHEDEAGYFRAPGALSTGATSSVLLEWSEGRLVSVTGGSVGVYTTSEGEFTAYQVDEGIAPCLLGDYSVIAGDRLLSWSGPTCQSDTPVTYTEEGLAVDLPL
ncbi:hypothetical protein AB0M72_13200 [Nocardiopsis dassonvillei]